MPLFVARISGVTNATATTKTILQLKSNATLGGLKIKEFGISFGGSADATKLPVQVDVLIQTTAGTMTALTPVKANRAAARGTLSSAQHTATAEPTASDILWSEQITPAGGFDRIQLPLGEEFELDTNQFIGIRTITPEAVSGLTTTAYFRYED